MTPKIPSHPRPPATTPVVPYPMANPRTPSRATMIRTNRKDFRRLAEAWL